MSWFSILIIILVVYVYKINDKVEEISLSLKDIPEYLRVNENNLEEIASLLREINDKIDYKDQDEDRDYWDSALSDPDD